MQKHSNIFWNPNFQYAAFSLLNVSILSIIWFLWRHFIVNITFLLRPGVQIPFMLKGAIWIALFLYTYKMVPIVIFALCAGFEILYSKKNKKYIRLIAMCLITSFFMLVALSFSMGLIQAFSDAARSAQHHEHSL